MSRSSLPSTPLPGTPTLRVPSPTRTPAPLPLFSTGGPYTYTGQITRKYASRFTEINKTRNDIKNVEEQWEKEASEKGVAVEDLMKSMEKEYTWDDEGVTRVENDITLHESTNSEGGAEKEEKDGLKKKETPTIVLDKRLSLEDEHFVDALTSPMEKPK